MPPQKGDHSGADRRECAHGVFVPAPKGERLGRGVFCERGGIGVSILLSILPWVLYITLVGRQGTLVALGAASVVVTFAILRGLRRRNPKLLDIGNGLFFYTLLPVSWLAQPTWIETHAFVLGSGGPFLIAFVSILIGRPFTIQYARESVDPAYWQTPSFYRINRTISCVWCGVFVWNLFFSYLYSLHPHPVLYLMTVVSVVGGFAFTRWYPDAATRDEPDDEPDAEPEHGADAEPIDQPEVGLSTGEGVPPAQGASV